MSSDQYNRRKYKNRLRCADAATDVTSEYNKVKESIKNWRHK